jgi:hypothetical protein
MRRVTLVLGAAIALAMGASRCTPFSEEERGTPGVSSDAAADAPAPDAGSDGAGDAASCVFPTCESFDEPNWESRWNSTGDVSADTSHYVSSPRSLRIPSNGSLAVIRRSLPTAKQKITVKAKVKIAARGDGEIDFFGIRGLADPSFTGMSVYLIHTANGFSVQYPVTSGTAHEPVVATFTEWTAVSITIDLALREVRWDIGTQAGKKPLPTSYLPTERTLEVGIRYVRDVVNAWEVRFDDVETIDE